MTRSWRAVRLRREPDSGGRERRRGACPHPGAARRASDLGYRLPCATRALQGFLDAPTKPGFDTALEQIGAFLKGLLTARRKADDLSAESFAVRGRRSRDRRDVNAFVAIRRDLHSHPELAFEEKRTSDLVARLLAEWGFEVTAGIGGTGVVGALRRGGSQRALAIRANIDALPIREATGLPYASERDGVMHACGHDGHTANLLAAARRLARSGRFDGGLHVVFQPAEEVGAGARALLNEGLFERFPADAVFGLHNWPGVARGHFGFVPGPAMASADQATVRIRGRGGHGASPHETVDPVVAAAHVVTALQTVVSRNVDPLDAGVVTVGSIHGGEASNVIPEWVDLEITTRSFRPDVRRQLRRRIPALVRAQAASFGAEADVDYRLVIPPVVNHIKETDFNRRARARDLRRRAHRRGFSAAHGQRGFRSSARGAARKLRVRRRRRRAAASQPELRLQRPSWRRRRRSGCGSPNGSFHEWTHDMSDRIVFSRPLHPRAGPLIDGLCTENGGRYGDLFDTAGAAARFRGGMNGGRSS